MSILLPGQEPPVGNLIHTRSGWPIPTERVEPESLDLIRIRAQELTEWRANLTIRSISPHPYNCVGMIFASRRVWIEIDYIYDILREDAYRPIQQNEIMIGDIVLYKNRDKPTHVGIIVSIDRSIGPNIRIMSKWGRDAEFIHFVENVPSFFGSPEEYWTDRAS